MVEEPKANEKESDAEKEQVREAAIDFLRQLDSFWFFNYFPFRKCNGYTVNYLQTAKRNMN